jgi:hypothetical protein
MRTLSLVVEVTLVPVFLLSVAGCGTSPPESSAARDAPAAAAHDHGVEGPHGGQIIELGSETHHAELVHDDTSHTIGIYLLDGSAKQLAPIEAESVTINVAEDGEPNQYVLPAVRRPNDAAGGASYFELVSEPLCGVVCGESKAAKTTARVSITIGGQPFIGIIEIGAHDHDHDHRHDHAH